MDYARLTIGQMAKLNNISTQALRYYDQIGLLKPRFYDEDNKYRYYRTVCCAGRHYPYTVFEILLITD